MLALLGAFLISLSGARAQSPIPSYNISDGQNEYDFRVQTVADNSRFDATTDDAPLLSMDCLAANGTGQWTLSSQAGTGTTAPTATTFRAGWYLLANGLYMPSVGSSTQQCVPPGTVNNGVLPGTPPAPMEAKVTANLDNSVTYIWPDPANRGQFTVQGFSPSDISIPIKPGFPNSTGSRNVVQPAATISFPNCSTGGNNVVVAGDYRDEFDVCSDAAFIYIVWCANVAGTNQIFAAVLDGATRTLITGPIAVGAGERPTIGCDPKTTAVLAPIHPFFMFRT